MTLLIAVFVFLMMAASPTLAEMPPLKDIMSETEFDQTGMDKLSEDELQALQEWLEVFIDRDAASVMRNYRREQKRLRQNSATDSGGSSSNSEAGRSASTKSTKETRNRYAVVESHILGEFNGWSANTRFVLANGQVWENRRKESQRRTKSVTNPKVVIDRNLFGKYVMNIPELGLSIQVRRVK